MAVYTNDLRLKEIATGDEAGTWGTSTNTNLELVAEAFSFGTEAITTNADTHTTTIADGATDPGRSIYLQYTGALDSDCTVTIGPNTVSKLWFIENATTDSGSSGPYNIIIKQGSGATVTVPNGQVKAIYSDGAGSGGKMVDAFTDLHVNGLTSEVTGNDPALTVTSTDADASIGPLIVFKRESSSPADDDLLGRVNFNGLNDASTGKTYGRIQTTIRDASDGTEDGELTLSTIVAGSNRSRAKFGATETVFNEASVDLDFRVETDTDANALFVQGSSNRVMLGFNAQVAVAAINPHFGVVGTDNGSTSIGIVRYSADTGGPRLVLSKSRNGSITTAGGTIVGSSDTTGMIMFSADDGSDMATRTARIQSQVSGTPGSDDMPGHLQFFTTADGASSETEHMRITAAGNVAIGTTTASTELTVAGDITATSSGPSIFLTDTDNNPDYQIKNGNGTLRIIDATNSRDRLNFTENSTVFNEESADLNFRIETDGSSKKFFVDGGNNVILINNDAPVDVVNVSSTFQIHANSNANAGISIQRNTSNNSSAYINFAKSRGSASTSDFTVVQSGDVLGRISFVGADGTDFGHQAAKISGVANANFASNDVPGRLEFYTTSDGGTTVTERMRIDSTGNVGIGTTTTIGARLELAANNASSPLNTLRFTDLDTVTAANQQIGKIEFKSNDVTGDGALVRAFINCFAEDTSPSAAISFAVNAGGAGVATEEAMRITSVGRVGINRTSPNGLLHLQSDSGSDAELYIQTSSASDGSTICFGDDSSSTVGQIQYVHSDNSMRFRVTGAEAARIDTSGNLLVGTTNNSPVGNNVAGIGALNNGNLQITRDGGLPLHVNRKSDNGAIIDLRKDGTSVGNIGVRSTNNLFVVFRTESNGDGCGLTGSTASTGAIIPSDGDGDAVDNHIDLGASATRFDDVFSTGGINTSDRNEKQDIEDLSDAEKRVAVACKALIKKFRWKSSVAEKGDDARIHVGIIAQDLRDAFTAEGLDPARYSMWCSDTWTDETSGEEVTRQSVRYNELLAFIISAI